MIGKAVQFSCAVIRDLHLYGCILLASCLIQAITSAPTTPPPTPARWHSPCAGQTINSFDSLNAAVQTASASLTTMDNAVHYRNIHISALETKVLVASLKAHYADNRIQLTETVQYLNSLELKMMLNIDDVNPVTMDPATTNVTEIMKNMYRELAIVTVVMEQARLDQLNYEKAYGTDVTERFQSIENNGVYPCLCDLQLALRAHNSHVDFVISRDILIDSVRNLPNRSLRDQRDYIMLNVLDEILLKRSTQFARLHQHAQTQNHQ